MLCDITIDINEEFHQSCPTFSDDMQTSQLSWDVSAHRNHSIEICALQYTGTG